MPSSFCTLGRALIRSKCAMQFLNATDRAPIPHDSALTSAGAQLFLSPNWSLLAKFDGEFANGSQLYAGTGTLRYSW